MYGTNLIFSIRDTFYLTETVLYIKITVSYKWSAGRDLKTDGVNKSFAARKK